MLNPDGSLSDGSAYRLSRHPLNAAMTALFWSTPHLTTKRLAFNAVSTLYFVLGSFHEEYRLKKLYGAHYEAYRKSGVPFFVPSAPHAPKISARPPAGAPWGQENEFRSA